MQTYMNRTVHRPTPHRYGHLIPHSVVIAKDAGIEASSTRVRDTGDIANPGMKIVVVVGKGLRRPQHGEHGRMNTHTTMSTERKDAGHPATDAQGRHATGKDARDEQSGIAWGGLRELKDNWGETRNELRRDHRELTDADLDLRPGREQETIDRVGQRLKKTPEEALRLVQDVAQRHRKPARNSPGSTVGTQTQGMHKGQRDLPEAAERKARRDAPHND